MESQGIRPTWKSYSVFIKELCKASRTDDIVKDCNQRCIHKGEFALKEKVQQMHTASKLVLENFQESSMRNEAEEDTVVGQSKSEKVDCLVLHPILKTYSEQDVRDVCRILSSSLDWPSIEEKLEKSNIEFTPEFVMEILQICSMHGCTLGAKFLFMGGKETRLQTHRIIIQHSSTCAACSMK